MTTIRRATRSLCLPAWLIVLAGCLVLPTGCSGGQQQRVGIARALANSPQLILADEPTGELDSVTAHEILTLFRRIVKEEGVTVLMASHDALVDEYVDEVLQLKDGQIAAQDR